MRHLNELDYLDHIAEANYNGDEGDGYLHDTVIIFTERYDDGTLTVSKRQGVMPYKSTYWQSQPNGEYIVVIGQGGVRNTEIPKTERVEFAEFMSKFFNESTKFASYCRIQNDGGTIWQIQIEEKI